MRTAPPAVQPLGEAGWTVTLGDRVERATHERVLALAERLAAAPPPGMAELVPGYATLTVFFDPAVADADALRLRLGELAATPPATRGAEAPERPVVALPTRYDGPDLDEVAARTGLTRDQVVDLHSARVYRVYLLGFAPGFAYLGDLDAALVLPRRREPRPRVPAGSVGIAGAQTGVYPLATPGGWHLLGRTKVRLFDAAREPPALLHPGDRVRFEPVG
jgi:KipI family sensor histidine kinase inhibitor